MLSLDGGELGTGLGDPRALLYPSSGSLYIYASSNSIISPSNYRWPCCPANPRRISNDRGSNRNALCKTKNRVILIILDIRGGKFSGVAYLNWLYPNTAVVYIIVYLYSLFRISCRNKSMLKFNNTFLIGRISNGSGSSSSVGSGLLARA
jgi:hypothetical protein